MKNQMYITLLILPLLATGCGGRKETAQTMPCLLYTSDAADE